MNDEQLFNHPREIDRSAGYHESSLPVPQLTLADIPKTIEELAKEGVDSRHEDLAQLKLDTVITVHCPSKKMCELIESKLVGFLPTWRVQHPQHKELRVICFIDVRPLQVTAYEEASEALELMSLNYYSKYPYMSTECCCRDHPIYFVRIDSQDNASIVYLKTSPNKFLEKIEETFGASELSRVYGYIDILDWKRIVPNETDLPFLRANYPNYAPFSWSLFKIPLIWEDLPKAILTLAKANVELHQENLIELKLGEVLSVQSPSFKVCKRIESMLEAHLPRVRNRNTNAIVRPVCVIDMLVPRGVPNSIASRAFESFAFQYFAYLPDYETHACCENHSNYFVRLIHEESFSLVYLKTSACQFLNLIEPIFSDTKSTRLYGYIDFCNWENQLIPNGITNCEEIPYFYVVNPEYERTTFRSKVCLPHSLNRNSNYPRAFQLTDSSYFLTLSRLVKFSIDCEIGLNVDILENYCSPVLPFNSIGCSICGYELAESDEDKVVMFQKCKHSLHLACFKDMLKHGLGTCPICRENLFSLKIWSREALYRFVYENYDHLFKEPESNHEPGLFPFEGLWV